MSSQARTPENGTENDTERFLIFETSGQLFGLPIAAIVEILPMVTLTPVPAMPPFVVGFLNWHNSTTPIAILRLDDLLRLSQTSRVPGLHTPLLIVKNIPHLEPLKTPDEKEQIFGLLVERIHNLCAIAPAEIGAAEQTSFNGCVTGLLSLSQPEGMAAILSVERLLLAEERERLSSFAQLATERRDALRSADEGNE